MEKVKTKDTIIILIFIILAIGMVLGSIYMNNISEQTGSGIRDYLNSFLSGLQQGTDSLRVFKNSLKDNIILLIILFVSGFFRLGTAITAGMVIRKGFIIGFTASSFVKFYGIKGLLMMAAMMPGMIIIIPALLLFSAVSVDFSLNSGSGQQKKIILYILFTVITIMVFCLSSLAEGYLTTLFMRLLSPKLI